MAWLLVQPTDKLPSGWLPSIKRETHNRAPTKLNQKRRLISLSKENLLKKPALQKLFASELIESGKQADELPRPMAVVNPPLAHPPKPDDSNLEEPNVENEETTADEPELADEGLNSFALIKEQHDTQDPLNLLKNSPI